MQCKRFHAKRVGLLGWMGDPNLNHYQSGVVCSDKDSDDVILDPIPRLVEGGVVVDMWSKPAVTWD